MIGWRAWLICISLLLVVFAAGLWLRLEMWDWTQQIRFDYDINNGFKWGKRANEVGYLNLYETLGEPQRNKERIDYAPIRLGIMTAWTAWLVDNHLRTDVRDITRGYHAPLLNFNIVMEALTSVAIFVLVWQIARRGAASPFAPRGPPIVLASVAAMLSWLNPATIVEAHAWPQWDIWPMPFYLFAITCGLRRRWLLAGLLIGVGAMLKGQVLTVGWVLAVWALCIGQWRGALQLVIGTLTSIYIVGSPWTLSLYDVATQSRQWHPVAISLLFIGATSALLLPRRFSPTLVCLAILASLYISMTWLDGTRYWLQSSFEVGTWNYPQMRMGPAANLPAILQERYGWSDIETVVFTIPGVALRDLQGGELLRIGGDITIRTLLLSIFFVLSAACGIIAAWLDLRRDPRFVLAITLPWLIFFVFPCQIHERYLLFASACAAAWVVCGLGVTLLGMLMTLLALMNMLNLLLVKIDFAPLAEAGEQPLGFCRTIAAGTFPAIAWMLVLAMLVLLYVAFKPRRRDGAIV